MKENHEALIMVQVNLDMTDSMGPGKLVRHMQNPSYTCDKYLICVGLGPSILSVIYAKVCRTVVRHIQVHLYFTISLFHYLLQSNTQSPMNNLLVLVGSGTPPPPPPPPPTPVLRGTDHGDWLKRE